MERNGGKERKENRKKEPTTNTSPSDEKKESIDKNEKKGRLFLASIVASSASLSDIDLSLSLSHET